MHRWNHLFRHMTDSVFMWNV